MGNSLPKSQDACITNTTSVTRWNSETEKCEFADAALLSGLSKCINKGGSSYSFGDNTCNMDSAEPIDSVIIEDAEDTEDTEDTEDAEDAEDTEDTEDTFLNRNGNFNIVLYILIALFLYWYIKRQKGRK
jgi:hypothetical protein